MIIENCLKMKIGKEEFMRQAEKNTTAQEKIISAATREFAAHGFEAASMNVICKDDGGVEMTESSV